MTQHLGLDNLVFVGSHFLLNTLRRYYSLTNSLHSAYVFATFTFQHYRPKHNNNMFVYRKYHSDRERGPAHGEKECIP